MRTEVGRNGNERWSAGTWRIDDPGALERFLAPDKPLHALLGPYHSLAAEGVSRSYTARSLADAAAWWAECLEHVEQDSDLPGHPTTGPVAFLSMPFDPDGAEPIQVTVPSDVLAREHLADGNVLAWRTWVSPSFPHEPQVQREESPKRPTGVRVVDDGIDGLQERAAAASAAVEAGVASKIIVSRSVEVTADAPIDLRWIVRELARTCPGHTIFVADGLIGASPQVVLQRTRDMVRTQVLTGSVPTGSEEFPERLTEMLRPTSPMFRRHRESAEETAAALARHALTRPHPSGPILRRLPGVAHLLTDITTVVEPDTDTLALLGALHPVLDAVGLPYADAAAWLKVHGADRGRFGAPVGWLDAQGNATFVVALRCGQLSDDGLSMRLYADVALTSGISVDDAVRLSTIKLVPMCAALGIAQA